MAEFSYLSNPALKTILPEWKGNPVVKGRFIDPLKRFEGSFSKFLRWRITGNEKREEKRKEKWRLDVVKNAEFLHEKNNCIVWLGHATFFIQINEVRLITDPVFGRISGVVPRRSELPCRPDDIQGIDYVLLSHAHRDHCDFPSLKKLHAGNEFTLLTGLKTGQLVSREFNKLNIQEAGWYQQFQLPEADLTITYLPAQHWSNRFGWDTNETLWGSFMIESSGLRIFFGGDSGYSSYFRQTGMLFPDLDIAILGVGAYTPAFMMQDVHTSPQEAVQAFHDLGAKTLIPMHYGTFDLADEPLGEPCRILRQMEAENRIKGTLNLLQPGAVMHL